MYICSQRKKDLVLDLSVSSLGSILFLSDNWKLFHSIKSWINTRLLYAPHFEMYSDWRYSRNITAYQTTFPEILMHKFSRFIYSKINYFKNEIKKKGRGSLKFLFCANSFQYLPGGGNSKSVLREERTGSWSSLSPVTEDEMTSW